jgi:hypothetical protein
MFCLNRPQVGPPVELLPIPLGWCDSRPGHRGPDHILPGALFRFHVIIRAKH